MSYHSTWKYFQSTQNLEINNKIMIYEGRQVLNRMQKGIPRPQKHPIIPFQIFFGSFYDLFRIRMFSDLFWVFFGSFSCVFTIIFGLDLFLFFFRCFRIFFGYFRIFLNPFLIFMDLFCIFGTSITSKNQIDVGYVFENKESTFPWICQRKE